MTETPYGNVTKMLASGETLVEGNAWQLYDWATRAGALWPCSTLRSRGSYWMTFDVHGDLIDLPEETHEMDGHELTAWASDVLREAGFKDHPAIRGDYEND